MKTPKPESLTACYDDEHGEPCVPLAIAIKIERQRDEARGQRDMLAEVIEAASVLIAAKGRHNTMLAYNGLRDALQSLTTNAKVSDSP